MPTGIRSLNNKDVHFLSNGLLSSLDRADLDKHLDIPVPVFPDTSDQNIMIDIRLRK